MRVGGLVVNTGDLLHGDVNGVTRIPTEIVDQIPQAASEFAAAEKIVLDYVKSPGAKIVAEFTARRKEFAAAVTKIAERVRPKR